jgi:5-methylcytosine-specific restriction endonuclease McrA
MHITSISISTPVLVAILLAVIIIGVILRVLSSSRHRQRTGGRPQHRRSRRSPLRTRAGKPDHGALTAKRHGHERSSEWPRVEKEHLRREPACAACGYRGKGLKVHHIKPFHLHPNLELDPNNLITLCEIKKNDHHLLIGHLDDWESYNPNVREDVKRYHKKTADQIRENKDWQKEVARRPSGVAR